MVWTHFIKILFENQSFLHFYHSSMQMALTNLLRIIVSLLKNMIEPILT